MTEAEIQSLVTLVFSRRSVNLSLLIKISHQHEFLNFCIAVVQMKRGKGYLPEQSWHSISSPYICFVTRSKIS
jgi:hypothetical protein